MMIKASPRTRSSTEGSGDEVGEYLDSQWSATDLAYFAGIIDGEGCFCLHKSGVRDVFNSSLSVGNTDPRMIHWIHDRFGGRILRRQFAARTRCKVFYHWRLLARDLESVITAVIPYLVVKREQAELMLAYRKTIVPRGRGERPKNVQVMSSEEVQHRHDLKARLAVLNKRGVA